MEDRLTNQSSYLPELDKNDIYDGVDDNPDIDERYKRVSIDSIGEAAPTRNRDIFKILSKEINSEKYQIRTPAQQSDWARQKTQNSRQMAKYLLHLKCVSEKLVEACNSGKHDKLFGEMKTNKENQVRLDYERNEEFQELASGLLMDHLDGESSYSKDELFGLIVEDYHLSYAQFIRPSAIEMIAKHESAKKAYEKYSESLPKGTSLSLFGTHQDTESSPVSSIEDETGLDWATLCTLMRSVKLLHQSSERLKERLVSTNLRSCLRSAMNFYHSIGGTKNVNFDEKDLINEAAMGLMHASDMYVYGTSARFTTYADYWIRLKVTRYTKDNNPVRVPVHVTDMAQLIIKEFRLHHKKPNVEPLTREETQVLIKKKIPPNVWQLAQNRFGGKSLSISCVSTEGEEGEMAFDNFTDPNEECETSGAEKDSCSILAVAESLVNDNPPAKDRTHITSEQMMFIRQSFVDDLKNPEIAELHGGKIDSKYVRTEINRAIERIRRAMGVKL